MMAWYFEEYLHLTNVASYTCLGLKQTWRIQHIQGRLKHRDPLPQLTPD